MLSLTDIKPKQQYYQQQQQIPKWNDCDDDGTVVLPQCAHHYTQKLSFAIKMHNKHIQTSINAVLENRKKNKLKGK